jgi:perosamine synthetase
LRDRMKLFRSHGMSSKRYWHEVPGHNFRLPNLQAAIGCAQIEQIDRIIFERNRVYSMYKKHLENQDGVTLQKYSKQVEPVVWAVAVKLDNLVFPQGRDKVMDQLKQFGIETRPGFYSANTMPHIYGKFDIPICNIISQQIISFPSSPTLTEEEIEYICVSFNSLKK